MKWLQIRAKGATECFCGRTADTRTARTNPEQLWTSYIQLTEAEATFRALKSELSIRPIFHQLERRAKAHILVAFLGYAMWVTLRHLLLRRRSELSPVRALDLLSRLPRADIILPTTEGREIRLRRITTPSAEQPSLLDQLGLELPKRLSFDTECSADFAQANTHSKELTRPVPVAVTNLG